MITDPSNPSSLSKIPKETQFLRYEMIWTQKKEHKNDRFLSLHPKDPSFKFLLLFLLLEQVTCKMSGPSHRFGGPSWQAQWPGSPRCQWRFIRRLRYDPSTCPLPAQHAHASCGLANGGAKKTKNNHAQRFLGITFSS